MLAEGLLLCSQERVTDPYSQPDERSPYPATLFA
jgi:hypothetical protein